MTLTSRPQGPEWTHRCPGHTAQITGSGDSTSWALLPWPSDKGRQAGEREKQIPWTIMRTCGVRAAACGKHLLSTYSVPGLVLGSTDLSRALLRVACCRYHIFTN